MEYMMFYGGPLSSSKTHSTVKASIAYEVSDVVTLVTPSLSNSMTVKLLFDWQL